MLRLDRTRLLRLLNGAAFFALFAWIGYAAFGKNVFGRAPWPDGIVDYRIIYVLSKSIVATQTYPPLHAYPPPAIVFQWATALFDYPVSAAIFMTLHTLAAIACWRLLFPMLRQAAGGGTFILALAAFALASPYFFWELRSQNCNIFFLLFLLLFVRALDRGRAAAAGIWLALSFAMKLFSVLVIPYLLWKRQTRAFLWCLGASAFLWGVIPAAVFGLDGFIPIYQSWLNCIAENAASRANFNHTILTSFHNSASWISHGDVALAATIVNAVWIAWLAATALGWWTSKTRRDPPGDSFGLMADVAALTLAPIALSPYFEPYHALPFVIPVVLLLSAAADGRQRVALRLGAVAAILAACWLTRSPAEWHMRGLWTNVNLWVATTAALLVAWLRVPYEESEVQGDGRAPIEAVGLEMRAAA